MIKEKIQGVLKNRTVPVTLASVGTVLLSASSAFASTGDSSISTAVTGALETVVTDTLATIAAVAPFGITIFGTMLAWKYAMRFFRSISK